MKFTLSPKKPKLLVGSERTLIKFAWFPKRLTDTKGFVWLESYVSVQVFEKRYVRDDSSVHGYYIYDWFEVNAK